MRIFVLFILMATIAPLVATLRKQRILVVILKCSNAVFFGPKMKLKPQFYYAALFLRITGQTLHHVINIHESIC